jgi:hypothetical protein
MAESFPQAHHIDSKRTGQDSQTTVVHYAANEIVFGVVGHVGSGTSDIARALEARLQEDGLEGGSFDVQILKASEAIRKWAHESGREAPDKNTNDLSSATRMQDLGDDMRESTGDSDKGDPAAVARALVCQIRATRATNVGDHVEVTKFEHVAGRPELCIRRGFQVRLRAADLA